MRICVALLALVACKDASHEAKSSAEAARPANPAPAPAGPGDDGSQCPQQPFAQSTPVAEASGAAWLTIDGTLSLVVVADSGHTGDYAILDPDTGETRELGKLPLGKLGDDLEGLAARDDKLYGLTSDGWMRVWQRKGKAFSPSAGSSSPGPDGAGVASRRPEARPASGNPKGFELVEGPYAIGSEADGTICSPKQKCAINYEGLALAPAPQGSCAGFACSKGDGHLYCLTEQDGRYVVDPTRRIPVTRAGVLGDCAFSDRGTLWVGNNAFGLSEVFRVDGWADPKAAKVVSANAFGIGFPEVIAARGDIIYRMSDTGGSPSLLAKFRCLAINR